MLFSAENNVCFCPQPAAETRLLHGTRHRSLVVVCSQLSLERDSGMNRYITCSRISVHDAASLAPQEYLYAVRLSSGVEKCYNQTFVRSPGAAHEPYVATRPSPSFRARTIFTPRISRPKLLAAAEPARSRTPATVRGRHHW